MTSEEEVITRAWAETKRVPVLTDMAIVTLVMSRCEAWSVERALQSVVDHHISHDLTPGGTRRLQNVIAALKRAKVNE